jgi:hypothetical protein
MRMTGAYSSLAYRLERLAPSTAQLGSVAAVV